MAVKSVSTVSLLKSPVMGSLGAGLIHMFEPGLGLDTVLGLGATVMLNLALCRAKEPGPEGLLAGKVQLPDGFDQIQ